MSSARLTDDAFDALLAALLEERAQGPAADALVGAVARRTARMKPLPGWLAAERFVPVQVAARLRVSGWLLPIVLVIALLLALTVAVAMVGSARRLPPPFGLAAPGSVGFMADGNIWTSNADGSHRVRITFDQQIDMDPIFSPDGTKIAFKRLPVAGSKPDWQDWGDVVVADADGGHKIVLDPLVHSPSPVTWSPDGRYLVYSRTVDGADQVIVAATDGSGRRQITSGPQSNWGPTLSPDGHTVAFVKGDPVVGIFVIQIDGTAERRITTQPTGDFDRAEWSPDGTTLLFAAGATDGHEDIWEVGLDRAPERRVIASAGNDFGATWSPDGRTIAYLNASIMPNNNTNSGLAARVMVAAADGSGQHPISGPGDWFYPQWSPDGRHVLAVDGRTRRGQPIVAILDPAGVAPAVSFAIPGGSGFGRANTPTWQRLAP